MKVKIVYSLEAASGVMVGSTSEVLKIGIDKGAMRSWLVTLDPSSNRLSNVNLGPVIPGSTVKGKVRDQCERIVRSIGTNRRACESPLPSRMCPPGQPPCDICEFFGGPAVSSRLFFSDAACQIAKEARPFSTKVQTGVSLSRRRRVAEHERLFFQERAAEGLTYEGVIDAHLDPGLADRQLALIVVGLERLVAIGGGKSRGGGWSRITVREVRKETQIITCEHIQTIREAIRQW